MSQFAQEFVREPATHNPEQYAARVHRLAAIYFVLFVASVSGIALLMWRGKLFITLAQRSNVETLVLAFLYVFFAYMALITARGAWGACHVLTWWVAAAFLGKDRVEARKQSLAARAKCHRGPSCSLDRAIELESCPREPVLLPVGDGFGPLGTGGSTSS